MITIITIRLVIFAFFSTSFDMRLEDYLYNLPEKNIAIHPLKDRSSSKLLKYEKGTISHHKFNNIHKELPKGSLLVFNNTKVIPARLFFTKATGALIEIFILEPHIVPQRELAMQSSGSIRWECMVRNLKKWKNDKLCLQISSDVDLYAELVDRENQIVEFSWTSEELTFAEILEKSGKIPLPPYLHREATDEDLRNYQTVYAKQKGAVAAPTAGLHFTPEVLESLKKNNIISEYLTLHVSAGTFQPIKADNVKEHKMHQEEIVVTAENLSNIINHEGPIIPVGTTSMRTLESVYWYGVKLLTSNDERFFIETFAPYEDYKKLPTRNEAYNAVLQFLIKNEQEQIIGKTEIFIYPGYEFKVCSGLVTNFHLPGSTLILLVAALIGDRWKEVYEEALNNDYRFLSYGDSSLLLP